MSSSIDGLAVRVGLWSDILDLNSSGVPDKQHSIQRSKLEPALAKYSSTLCEQISKVAHMLASSLSSYIENLILSSPRLFVMKVLSASQRVGDFIDSTSSYSTSFCARYEVRSNYSTG